MRFKITGVEVFKQRQKTRHPCIENWKHHDEEILKKHVSSVGCRAPYLHAVNTGSLCTRKDQMQQKFRLRTDNYGIPPPCKTMRTINYQYEENFLHTNTLQGASWARPGYFFIGISLYDSRWSYFSLVKK